MYTIEKCIPIPDRKKIWSEKKELLLSMDRWDSFFIETIRDANLFRNAIQGIKEKKYSIRKIDRWFRCWRIS